MLFSIKEIQDYQLRATDGDFGEIKTFLIDDFEWAVRYLVVEVGSRHVMLSVMALNSPDRENKVLPLNISKEKIINGPTFDLNQPVSREVERQFSDYYEWPYYWEPNDVPNTLPGDLTAVPLIDLEIDREKQEEERDLIPETGAAETKPNDHLRSTRTLFGDTIHTTNDDRDAGKLDDMITQDEDWNILYLVLDTGGLLSSKKVLIAPSWVQKIDEPTGQIDVNLRRETIQEGPEFRSVLDLDAGYQSKLNDYYGQ